MGVIISFEKLFDGICISLNDFSSSLKLNMITAGIIYQNVRFVTQ